MLFVIDIERIYVFFLHSQNKSPFLQCPINDSIRRTI
nr:MAG TPA: hypothetical protein [Caudoviricetes sp.]